KTENRVLHLCPALGAAGAALGAMKKQKMAGCTVGCALRGWGCS
ncbi:hypothetical protein A2U01_0079220, partial [Trifolium medium]|nr:hypothetical protein [Trifolium medium]